MPQVPPQGLVSSTQILTYHSFPLPSLYLVHLSRACWGVTHLQKTHCWRVHCSIRLAWAGQVWWLGGVSRGWLVSCPSPGIVSAGGFNSGTGGRSEMISQMDQFDVCVLLLCGHSGVAGSDGSLLKLPLRLSGLGHIQNWRTGSLSVHECEYLSICLSVCLSIHLPIHPSTIHPSI